MTASLLSSIEKLKGRENFTDWQFSMQTYLELEDLWDSVENGYKVENPVDATKKSANTKARAKLILMLDPVNYVHVHNCTTAKDVWDKLISTFQDSGLTRKVSLLRTLITTKLSECDSVSDYVSKILSTVHKLNSIKFTLTDEWVGTFLLAGLPDDYRPMIMGLESSGVAITGDSIKTKLLQDVKMAVHSDVKLSDDGSALYAKKTWKPKCFSCNEYGHLSKSCPKLKKGDQQKHSDSGSRDHRTSFALTSNENINENQRIWFIDSGASAHMTVNGDWLNNVKDPPKKQITVANNERIPIAGVGDLSMSVRIGKKSQLIDMENVLHVPKLNANLFSVSQTVKKGNVVIFDINGCRITNKDKTLLATADLVNDMYQLNWINEEKCYNTKVVDFELWHRRLGHMSHDYMKHSQELIDPSCNHEFKNKMDFCEVCLKGKQCRLPFQHVGTRADEQLELVHSDLCGPMEVDSLAGSRYFFTLIDDCTHKVFVYCLKRKDEVFDAFVNFKNLVENQSNKKIKILRTDNGGEYCNRVLKNFLQGAGIQHQLTVPHTPQQNGVAERMNRTIVEKARCMLIDANMDKRFWAEAVSTAVYIINRSPTKCLTNKTPEEAWSKAKPNLNNLRVFGCKAMVHIPKCKRRKFDAKSEECSFVGYDDNTKGYRVYSHKTGDVFLSRDVVFHENKFKSEYVPQTRGIYDYGFPFVDEDEVGEADMPKVDAIQNLADQTVDENEIRVEERVERQNPIEVEDNGTLQPILRIDENEVVAENDDSFHSLSDDPDISSDENEVPVNQILTGLRRSARTPKPKKFDDYLTYNVASCSNNDPISVEEALDRPDAHLWKAAMQREFDSLIDNKTWCLEELPNNKKSINCKWVFKVKSDCDNNVHYKARLVVKGCSQRKGIDYEETYSPVVRYSSIRFLMSLAAEYKLEIDQMDAVSAFLQGDLEEEIYMVQPEGFNNGSKVCKLNKAIYGLKQASRAWNKKLDGVLVQLGFQRSTVDECIYFNIKNGEIVIIAVYVDDILIFSNDKELTNKLKRNLSDKFKMKDIGEAKMCLGIRITRDRKKDKIFIDQEKYINGMLEKFNMADCNPVLTPIDINTKLSKQMSPKDESEREAMENVPYQEAVGSLLYAAQSTRPDIAFAVNAVSRYNNNPGKAHWNAVKRIFRYLKGTSHLRLEYSKGGPSEIIGFCDADWASDIDERRSITGYVFMKQGGAVTWNTRKQQTVALSTTEAEYMAMSASVQEAMYLRNLQIELKLNDVKSTNIFCDNRSALNLSQASNYSPRTKHIDIRHHYIREKVQDGSIKFVAVSTDDMAADVLTKGLSSIKHNKCLNQFGLK